MQQRDEHLTESQQYSAFQRLHRMLKVIASGSGRVFVSRVITPVIDFGDLLDNWGNVTGPVMTHAGATSETKIALIVPRGKRFRVQNMRLNRLTGDATYVTISVNDASTGISMDYALVAAASAITWEPVNPVVMDELDQIDITSSGAGASESTSQAKFYLAEADAFADA